MKSKKNLIIIAIVIAISLIGITYAFFDYYMLGSNQKATAGMVNLTFNEGEHTINRGNIFPETIEKARKRTDNFITFTVSGVNTTEDQDIWYEIMLNDGDSETGMTRFNPEDLVFDLIELNEDGTEGDYVVDALSYSDFNARRIWVDTVDRNTSETVNKTYKLRMWLSEDVLISDSNSNANYPSTGYENYYASVKVSVYGDFVEKEIEYQKNYMTRLGSASNVFWPDNIETEKANISEVHFISLNHFEINDRYDSSTIKADVTDTSLGGSVKTWLEVDATDTSKYIMYVASEGETYFPSNCTYMFNFFENLKEISFQNVDTSNATNFYYLFYKCSSLETLNLNKFDTSNVTDLTYAFGYCNNLNKLDINNWDTSEVTSMLFTFFGCTNLKELEIGNLDTSSVVEMMGVFTNCSSLTSIDLSNWDMTNVTRTIEMFKGCTNLTEVNLSNWNLKSLTYPYSMFQGCTNLQTVTLKGWKLWRTFILNQILGNENDISNFDLSNWDISLLTSLSGMFANCSEITSLNLSNWDTSMITDMSSIFNGCTGLANLNIDSFTFDNVNNANEMFKGMPDDSRVIVEGVTQQNWILALSSPDNRPSAWTNLNVIVK